MKQYIELCKKVLSDGYEKKDRTETGTISYFGHQIRLKMSDGLPLLVLKKTSFKSILVELLWFLKGDTNIQWLEQNGCSIWRDWPYKKYVENQNPPHLSFKEFGERIKTDNVFAKQYGDLGPVYGKQWVGWQKTETSHINQIQVAIDKLKKNPEDRGIIVSAWNVSELGEMALRPCHAFFQFFTRELTYQERSNLYWKKHVVSTMEFKTDKSFDEANIPKYALSIQLYQRSADILLGVPFNLCSYSILLHMFAQCVNMVAEEFIWTGGDCHIYKNHIEQTKELISRFDNLPNDSDGSTIEPKLPTLKLNSDIKNIFEFKIEDFILEGYNPMPPIKAPVAV